MRFDIRTPIVAAVAGLLAACATSTPYAPATEEGGYGFSEQQIESNRYRIVFRGNSSTTRETVENFLLYRAAELTLANGYDYFITVENQTEASRSYSTSGFGGPPFYGRYGFGYGPQFGFPYYAYGFGWGAPYYDTYTREITRYSGIAFVTMHKGAEPADNPAAFDAREVAENLRPLVFPAPQS